VSLTRFSVARNSSQAQTLQPYTKESNTDQKLSPVDQHPTFHQAVRVTLVIIV